MAIKNPESINEHIDRIKFISDYTINEAKYSLVDGLEEDDGVPDEIYSSTPVSPIPVREEEPQMGNDGLPVEEPAPEGEFPEEGDMGVEEMGAEEEMAVEDPMATDPAMGMEEPMPEEPAPPSVDQIQNDIIKTSVSAMQKMNSELNSLESTLSALNSKIDGLSQEVEQVKEPTNVEKLMSRKEDSHPFYYNLNDMWDDNSFQARREVEDSEGMKQLEDGSFVADFDTLPKFTEQEIKDSF